MRRLGVALLSAMLAAACAAPSGSPATDAPELRPAAVVDTTPDGLKQALASFEGTPLVVNWWASWCGPCAREMPLLVEAAGRYEGRVAFLGVNPRDDPEAAADFIERYGIPFPSVGDPDGSIMRDQRILGMPVTRFYRSDGIMAFAQNGEIDSEQLTYRIEELLRID